MLPVSLAVQQLVVLTVKTYRSLVMLRAYAWPGFLSESISEISPDFPSISGGLLSYNLRLPRLLSPRRLGVVTREVNQCGRLEGKGQMSGVWHSLVEIVKKVVINKKG